MSVRTNEPIVLNSTIVAMKEKMQERNALLSVLAGDKLPAIYEDISKIASIVRGNSVEQNAKLFRYGDQIIIPWKDMDSSNHNTDATAYEVPLNILGHRMVELETGEQVPGMFVGWHYASPFGVQFSNYQAFMNCTEGLPAGTYYVTLGASWGTNAISGTSWSFTLTQNVPAGGRLSGFEGMPDKSTSTWQVKAWASPNAASPQETVSVTQGTNGEFLGTMKLTMLGDEGLNCMHSVGYGHNRWGTSAIRQYLNSTGAAWWQSKEDFDIRPNEHTKKGFVTGFADDFLAATRPVKVMTALNTVEGFTDSVETTFDRFFLPSLEEIYAKVQIANVEGPYFPYWKDRLGRTTPNDWYSANLNTNYIHYALNGQTSPQYVRLRSAYRGLSYSTWGVNSTGHVGSNPAYYATRFSPVCVIC